MRHTTPHDPPAREPPAWWHERFFTCAGLPGRSRHPDYLDHRELNGLCHDCNVTASFEAAARHGDTGIERDAQRQLVTRLVAQATAAIKAPPAPAPAPRPAPHAAPPRLGLVPPAPPPKYTSDDDDVPF